MMQIMFHGFKGKITVEIEGLVMVKSAKGPALTSNTYSFYYPET